MLAASRLSTTKTTVGSIFRQTTLLNGSTPIRHDICSKPARIHSEMELSKTGRDEFRRRRCGGGGWASTRVWTAYGTLVCSKRPRRFNNYFRPGRTNRSDRSRGAGIGMEDAPKNAKSPETHYFAVVGRCVYNRRWPDHLMTGDFGMRVRTLLFLIALSCSGTRFLLADLIVDDFSVAPVVVDGPATTVQDELPPAHVVGGTRTIVATGTGDRVQVLVDGGLQYTSDSGYGLQLTYGDGESALIADPRAAGDRLVLQFSGSGSPAARLAHVVIIGPATSSDVELRFYNELNALGDEGNIEFLLDDFPADLTSIYQIGVSFLRALPTGGFVLDEISIAGPPVPGDYSRDGMVDAADYDRWRQQFGQKSTQALFTADGNADHVVDAADYTIWRNNLGTAGASLYGSDLAVPEPSTQFLVVFVWLPMVGLRVRIAD